MTDINWNIEPMRPVEFTFVPCQPSLDEMIRAMGIPERLFADGNSSYSTARADAMIILERERKAWLEIQRRKAAGEEW